MKTPFNFTTNNDIVGGNSGSPLIERQGRDRRPRLRRQHPLDLGRYWFDERMNRAIAVHPAFIREALEKVYGAEALLAEIDAK